MKLKRKQIGRQKERWLKCFPKEDKHVCKYVRKGEESTVYKKRKRFRRKIGKVDFLYGKIKQEDNSHQAI